MAVDDYLATTSTTGRVTIDGSTTGTLEAAGDRDWFKVTLEAGKQYSFTLDSGLTGGLMDPYLKLYSSDGVTVIGENDDTNGLNSQVDVLTTAAGTYYLEASSSPDSTFSPIGSYVLSATGPAVDDYAATIATTGSVAPGGSTTGQLGVSGDSDWFAVTLVAGNTYRFNLDSGATNGLPDPLLSLYNSSGTLITSNDNSNDTANAEITYTATATGKYFLGASSGSVGSDTGSYTLSATAPIADDYTATTATSGRVSPGGSATGTVDFTGDSDWFAITLTAGAQYVFTLAAGASNGLEDPLLSLYSSSGALITSDDDSGGALSSQISYTATSTGTYYLGASNSPHSNGSTAMGSYTVNASFPSINGATVMTGTSGNDSIDGSAGNDLINGGAGVDTVNFTGNRSDFAITRNSDGSYNVADNTGTAGNDTVSNVEQLKFADLTVSLTVQANAASISAANLNSLTELYVAYFNRVPDADGLSYWIDQLKGGQSLEQIGTSFYAAAILPQYAPLTGYSSSMTNADFVTLIYKNVLGRSGATAPPPDDVNYWANNLATGVDTRGSLIKTMLASAHSFKGDVTWGWVADLLDNKVTVGQTFAVSDGLSYINPADSITHGMAIAAAVTSTGTADAISLIGVTDGPL